MRRERKGKTLRKTLGIVLSAVMLVSGITFMPGSAIEVQAAATTKDVNLGFGGISDPTSTESSATAWTGSKVYYGDKLWRVLDDSGFLFSEDLLETKAYHDTRSGITWENCTLRSYLNGQTLNSNFTGTEQDAIKDTSVTNGSNPDYETAGGNNTTDKLFLLSLAEVKNSNYGFGSDATRAASARWWLRSPGLDDNSAASVYNDGYVDSSGYNVSDGTGSVRPAFNLNLSSVLFTSASGASKSSFGVVGDSNVSNNTWKLTLEGTENTLDANKTNGKTSLTAGYSAENLTISHSAATTLTDATQISAMLTDSYGTVLYYGSVNSDTTATSSTVTIPAGLAVGTYSLYVFAEDVNTGNLTDYATALGTAISINVNAAPSTYAVTVNNGTGDGSYAKDATVTITADAAPSGQHFKEWTGADSLNFTSGSKTSTTATFTMPANAVTLTATYENDTPPAPSTYAVTVNNGTGDGNYEENATVTITADAAPSGQHFKEWTGADSLNFTSGSKTSTTATFTMPANAVTLTATYENDTPPAPSTYAVTVNNGTGDGSYAKDATVTITADAAPSGQHFKEWTGADSLNFTSGSKTSATATFTMPANAVEVTATYENDLSEPSEPSLTYHIIDGANGTFTIGSDGNLVIIGDGAYSKFKEVKVDGVVIAGANYTVTEGATIITLKSDYLKGLKTGNHTFELVWTDGSAATTFTVKEAVTEEATSCELPEILQLKPQITSFFAVSGSFFCFSLPLLASCP
jgi:hypothetical protein